MKQFYPLLFLIQKDLQQIFKSCY